jgi:exodeoxyribonuclease VII small subunit
MAQEIQTGKKFEVAMAELEDVVEQLESGDLALEDALAVFEKGVALVQYCNQKLNEVEKRVEILVKDKEGKLQFKAMEILRNGEETED